MIDRDKVPVIFGLLLFLVPQNIYVIGDRLATGIQWALFRYQVSDLGNSLILASRDLYYVIAGILKGATAISTVVWLCGAVLLVAAFCLLVVSALRPSVRLVRPAGLAILASGILFLLADIVQYGIAFNNMHGYALPVGVPLVLVIGAWCYREGVDIPPTDAPKECSGETPSLKGDDES
jgi:hypothetical protein